MEKKMYSVQEASEVLGISRSFTCQLIRERKLPALDLGQRKVVPIQALEKWIQDSAKM